MTQPSTTDQANRPRPGAGPRLRRASATPLIGVLLGVLTTLTLAWAAPVVTARWPDLAPVHRSAESNWCTETHGGRWSRAWTWSVERIVVRRLIFLGTPVAQPFHEAPAPPPWAARLSLDQREGYPQVTSMATGWPWRAFRSETWQSWRPPPPPPVVVTGFGDMSGRAEPRPAVDRRGSVEFTLGETAVHLPLLPIWPGLLADVAVTSVAWWGLLLLVGPLRRATRGLRGRCTACGYPSAGLRAGVACPECGTPRG